MPTYDFVEAADIAEAAIGGWRYIFSRDYRLRKHREWRENWISAFFEILFGLFGIVVSLGLIGLAAHLLWPEAKP